MFNTLPLLPFLSFSIISLLCIYPALSTQMHIFNSPKHFRIDVKHFRMTLQILANICPLNHEPCIISILRTKSLFHPNILDFLENPSTPDNGMENGHRIPDNGMENGCGSDPGCSGTCNGWNHLCLMASSRRKVSTMAGRRGSTWDRGAGMVSQEEWACYISQCAWTLPPRGCKREALTQSLVLKLSFGCPQMQYKWNDLWWPQFWDCSVTMWMMKTLSLKDRGLFFTRWFQEGWWVSLWEQDIAELEHDCPSVWLPWWLRR